MHLTEQCKEIIPRNMNNYSTAVPSPLQTMLPSVMVLWLAVTALVLGNSVVSFPHGLTKKSSPLISMQFGMFGFPKVFEMNVLLPFYKQ